MKFFSNSCISFNLHCMKSITLISLNISSNPFLFRQSVIAGPFSYIYLQYRSFGRALTLAPQNPNFIFSFLSKLYRRRSISRAFDVYYNVKPVATTFTCTFLRRHFFFSPILIHSPFRSSPLRPTASYIHSFIFTFVYSRTANKHSTQVFFSICQFAAAPYTKASHGQADREPRLHFSRI